MPSRAHLANASLKPQFPLWADTEEVIRSMQPSAHM
jgi:hypothetical protein